MDKIDHVLAEIASIRAGPQARKIGDKIVSRADDLLGYLADHFTDAGLDTATSDVFKMRSSLTADDLRAVPEGHAAVMVVAMLMNARIVLLANEGSARFDKRFGAHMERIMNQERADLQHDAADEQRQ